MGKFFVSRPVFAIALAIAMVIVGAAAVGGLPVEQYPDITPPVVEVSASYPGADAQTVNDAVATPLAQSIMGVSDMLYMQTTSANDGSMTLQVTFGIGSDPDMDAVFTQNDAAAAAAQLPAAVTREGVTTRKSMTGFLIVYALYSDGRYDDEFVSNYAYINIENRLLKINGVGKVSIMGSGEYAMRIWIRPDLLDYYGIPLADVISAVETQGGIYPAGQFGAEPAPEGTAYTYTVTMPPQISTPEEFAAIVVRADSLGGRVLLGDLADVSLGSQTYGMKSLFDGKPSALVAVYQEPGSNAVDVGRAVRREIAAISERFPDGVKIAEVVDSTSSIEAGVRDIFVTLAVALLLVTAIIYLFIQDWRAVAIPLVAIPVSLVGAFALFPLLGFSINIISLLGLVLAIGLVVDDAIVVVEAVQVNIGRGMPPREATVEAMRSVSSPIIATTAVLLAVFIPVSFSGGITGLLFRQFSVTIAVAVVISAFNALTLSPALCSVLLKPHESRKTGFFGAFNRWFDRRMQGYSDFTARTVRHAARTLCFVAAVICAIGATWYFLPRGFLPEEDQGYVMVAVDTPPASSLQVTTEAMKEADAVIRRMPGVAATSFAAGYDMLSGTASTDSGIIFVTLAGYGDRKLTAAEIAGRLNGELYAAVPSAQCYAFIPPSIPGLGVSSGISLEVQDLDGRGEKYLAENAGRLMDSLRRLPEIASVTTQFDDGIPQRRLDMDTDHALAEGVPIDNLYQVLSTMTGGTYVSNFNLFGRQLRTYVQAAPEYRTDASALDSYFVTDGEGRSVPVSAFVAVRDTTGAGFVTQFNLYRSISLNAAPAEKTSSTDAMKAVERCAAKVLPDDIGIAWSGLSYQENAAAGSGPAVYGLALVFVFLALAALYESWSLPLSILLSVPLAVLGALVFILAAHALKPEYVNDVYMQISLVMLIGLSAKNAILVVEYANRLFFEQGLSLAEAASGAARMRVRPIVMTAFAFILGVMPLVFAHGVYSTARNIMGLALVGGMLLATILGIFVYPALYYAIARIGGFERRPDYAEARKRAMELNEKER